MVRREFGSVTSISVAVCDERHERREHIPVRDQAGLRHHEQLAQCKTPRLDAQNARVNKDQPFVVGSGSF